MQTRSDERHRPGPPSADRPTFFGSAADFRRWLEQHHATARALWVGFYKKSTGRPSLTWSEAVDEALCFGWVDGVRRRVDAERYMNRFTPRLRRSRWSAVNVRRAEALIRAGRMRVAGRAAFEGRPESSGEDWRAQRDAARLAPVLARRFRANRPGWTFFQAQPPAYRQGAIWFVMSAKWETTRARRLDLLIACSAAGERLDPMKPRKSGPAA